MSGKGKPRIFIHVGPPKTATTSLQYSLQMLCDTSAYYGGVTQPRSSAVKELSHRIHAFCVSDEPVDSDLRRELRTILESHSYLLISEEMFLVDGVVTHQEKLVRLGQLFAGLPTTVLVSIRDPVEGLASLYQELFRSLSIVQKISFRSFVHGNQARVFDYEHVLGTLAAVGFADVRTISFVKLIKNELTYADLFGPAFCSTQRISVQAENKSKLSEQGRRMVGEIGLADAIRPNKWLPTTVLSYLKSSSAAYAIWAAAKSIPLISARSRPLIVPRAIAEDLRDKFARLSE